MSRLIKTRHPEESMTGVCRLESFDHLAANMATDLYGISYAVAYITFAVGLASSILRFYSRALVVKSWGWDDTSACFVMIVSIVHQVVLQLFLNIGCGKPGLVECSFESLDLLRTAFIQEIVIYGAHCVIKATFLLFYLRLSPEYPFRAFVYVGFALTAGVFISSLLMTVLQCIPFEKILNPMLHPEVKCIDTRTIMIIPPVLVTVLSVFAFGIVSVTVALVRLPVLVSVTSGLTDVSVDVGKMIIVAAFEVQCAIIAVNLPSLKALWTKFRGRQSTNGSNDRPYKLSSMDGGNQGDSKKNPSMGVITRLERGLGVNESEEELFDGTKTHSRMPAQATARAHSPEDDRSKGAKSADESIVVTTDWAVQMSPRGEQHKLPPKHGLGYLKNM
ncbi:hypothetical protein FZEAL_8541 [Fusarium zealandicum]|uniref:Rhodopsin domain-containing protein n=1 Tax=Fusarium zealandicum TaxID=1053134 RepID=A0A8H4UEA1_9HYPO|nr:hypothetical protein FZEAL_8541 [Fusarium zealandicum]